MTAQTDQQWLRKSSLIVGDLTTNGLDLSDFHFRFAITQSDEESPNTAIIRVFNLAPDTVKQITGKTPVEYTRVVLQAGYVNAQFGVIFDGTIKQFRKGRENATDTYLEILAAAGDVEYNFGVCNSTLAAGSTAQDRANAISAAMGLAAPGAQSKVVITQADLDAQQAVVDAKKAALDAQLAKFYTITNRTKALLAQYKAAPSPELDQQLLASQAEGDRALAEAHQVQNPAYQEALAQLKKMQAIFDSQAVPSSSLAVTGGTLPRGKVLWGLGRSQARCLATSMGSTWSIQDGQIVITPLTGYLPGEAVVLTRDTGMVGVPEQTDQGISIRCLLNPKLRIGGQVQVNNASVNQTIAQASSALPAGQQAFNSRTGVQFLADVSNDGFYRLYVVEHHGDTRGQEWYSDMICLSIDQSSQTVQAYG